MNMLEALALLPRATSESPANSDTAATPGRVGQQLHHPLADRLGALEGRAVGKLEKAEDIALVLGRDEARRHLVEAEPGQAQQCRIDHERHAAMPQHPAQHPDVVGPAALEQAVEAAEQPIHRVVDDAANEVLGRVVGLEQQRAEGGAERQRVERGDQGGNGDGQRKLLVELAGDAADEGGGNEHRTQHQRNSYHRPAHLVHRLVGGVHGRESLRDVPLDVLDHDDGVIDHNPDRQHQPEQREVVDGKAEGSHRRERADQRHRH